MDFDKTISESISPAIKINGNHEKSQQTVFQIAHTI